MSESNKNNPSNTTKKKYVFQCFLAIIIFIFLGSCNNGNKVENVERGFYYWKSNDYFGFSETEKIKDLNIRKIYYKFFEVDYSETMGNYPIEKNSPNSYGISKMDSVIIVPTIFIKNEIYKFNDEKSLDLLADNIVFLIEKYIKDAEIRNSDEIQIDCDWTKSTKDKYFYLLKKIKEFSGKKISCTLRLYPYKYPEIMGVPPVDKVSLMCYNLIKPLSEKDKNSIFDLEEFKKYVNKKRKYPIHLDIVLPVFYWSQLYQNNQYEKLVNMNTEEIKKFAKPIKPMWYEVNKDTTINDVYFKIGNQIKCEEVSTETIQDAISVIKKNIELDNNTTVSLFHLDNNSINIYNREEINNIYNSFTK